MNRTQIANSGFVANYNAITILIAVLEIVPTADEHENTLAESTPRDPRRV